MITGVIQHCTQMEVDRQYVDSDGQSTVGFAFCRLKAIGTQKLYRPHKGEPDAYTNLLPIGLGATAASHLQHIRVRPERGCQVTRQSQFASRDLIASRQEWFVA
jgi:TnpA family transposase